MRIAIASGKGGTGKTSLAVSLALALQGDRESQSEDRIPPLFLDCDVEAPDAHLFLHPKMEEEKDVELLIPVVDQDRCTLCGDCLTSCPHDALSFVA